MLALCIFFITDKKGIPILVNLGSYLPIFYVYCLQITSNKVEFSQAAKTFLQSLHFLHFRRFCTSKVLFSAAGP
jgi:hypothetical protein